MRPRSGEEVDQAHKVEQGAGDAIELVDEDDVDAPGIDIRTSCPIGGSALLRV